MPGAPDARGWPSGAVDGRGPESVGSDAIVPIAKPLTLTVAAAAFGSAACAIAREGPAPGNSSALPSGHAKVAWQRSAVINARTVRLLYGWPGSGPSADVATISYRRKAVHITLYQRTLQSNLPDTDQFKVTCAEVRLTHALR